MQLSNPTSFQYWYNVETRRRYIVETLRRYNFQIQLVSDIATTWYLTLKQRIFNVILPAGLCVTRPSKISVESQTIVHLFVTRPSKISVESPTIVHLCVTRPSKISVESPTIVHLCVTRPSKIFAKKINIFTQLAFIQSVDNLFHLFIVVCENEYFLIYNLHPK